MSSLYIILSSWPSLCQKMSKLVEIWQSYDKNNFDCFLDTVYVSVHCLPWANILLVDRRKRQKKRKRRRLKWLQRKKGRADEQMRPMCSTGNAFSARRTTNTLYRHSESRRKWQRHSAKENVSASRSTTLNRKWWLPPPIAQRYRHL